jgi:hypothetical protein
MPALVAFDLAILDLVAFRSMILTDQPIPLAP